MKTAIVIGATGLVGNELTRLLLKDSRIGQVKIFVRRKTGLSHSKLEEHVVDFNLPDEWKKLVTGDVLYSALGTTLKAAGSKEAQYTVDHAYQFNTAKAAAVNGVQKYVLVSAGGASANSKIFYSRMKGELERDIRKLPFETIHIIRPGMLKGHRANTRTGEIIGGAVLGLVSRLPSLKALQPIEGHEVAKAMINASFRHIVGIHSYSPGELFKLAELVPV